MYDEAVMIKTLKLSLLSDRFGHLGMSNIQTLSLLSYTFCSSTRPNYTVAGSENKDFVWRFTPGSLLGNGYMN